MCGFTAIVDLRDRRQIDRSTLERMNHLIAHRGPDGHGFHFAAGIGFGHRRLSIIDLEGGAQPLFNEDRSVVITFNGEIFNFAGLAAELAALGHVFATRSDTEVIVHAWEEWGPKCLDRFNGMFAFALWDARTETLFLARDRLGVKPLFYSLTPDGYLVAGSELKAVVAHPAVQRRMNPPAVEDYFTFGYVPDPDTIYESVKKLPPGTFMLVKRGSSRLAATPYWDVNDSRRAAPAGSPIELQDELRRRLREAVNLRLVSEVPLGAFLSGGVDSSAVVAMMRQLGHPKLLTCSIGFREQEFDESEYARQVAEALSTDHHLEVVSAGERDLAGRLMDIYDEPYADSSAIPTYRVCELARRHVTVALSGDGGDEAFLGYRRYKMFAAEEVVRSLIPAAARSTVFGVLGDVYPKLDWAPRVFRAKSTFQALARTSSEAYLHAVSIVPEATRRAVFSVEYTRRLQGYRSHEVFARHLQGQEFPDRLRMLQYLDYKTYLPGDILTKVDRASMAHGLEVRGPFLDYTLVEWAYDLPTSTKLLRGEGKHVLKKSCEGMLPDSILYRAKKGFAVPLDTWFRGPMLAEVSDAINGPALQESGIFRQDALRNLVREHAAGRRNHSAALWALLMFDSFLKRTSGEPVPMPVEAAR